LGPLKLDCTHLIRFFREERPENGDGKINKDALLEIPESGALTGGKGLGPDSVGLGPETLSAGEEFFGVQEGELRPPG